MINMFSPIKSDNIPLFTEIIHNYIEKSSKESFKQSAYCT